MRYKREGSLAGTVAVTLNWAFRHFWHWPWWEALLVAVPCGLAAFYGMLLVRATWPQEIPYGLGAAVAVQEGAGWRLTRIHPWWDCARSAADVEDLPHVHMTRRDRSRMILAIRGDAIQGAITR